MRYTPEVSERVKLVGAELEADQNPRRRWLPAAPNRLDAIAFAVAVVAVIVGLVVISLLF